MKIKFNTDDNIPLSKDYLFSYDNCNNKVYNTKRR